MFRLHSGNWQGGMCNSLHQLQQNGILCDLILNLADDKQVKAHSCVMAAASPYLREFIVAKRTNAHLDMLNTEALEALIAYMYSGELEFTKLLLPDIVAAARMLQMDPLVEELARYQHCFLQSPHRIVSRDGCVRQPDIASSLYLPEAHLPSKPTHSQEKTRAEAPDDDASSASEDEDENEDDEANNSQNTSLNNSLPDLSLPCDACGKTFKQKGALGMHYKSHLIETTNAKGEIDVVKCKACKVTLKKGLHFVVHLHQCAKRETFKLELQRTKDQPFHCPLCNNNFEQRGAFGSHMKTHCVEIFDKDHVRVAMKCKLCQNVYSEKSDFMEHSETCPGRKDKQVRIRCKFANCSHVFQSRSSMLKHYAIYHGRKTTLLFKSSQTLAKKTPVAVASQGTKVKSASTSKHGFKLKCSKCQKSFTSQSEWMRHKLSKHSFSCGKCGRKFATRCNFEVHLTTECPGKKSADSAVSCKLCGKQFPRLYNLTRHMPSCLLANSGFNLPADSQAKQVQCELCKKRLSCQAALVRHKSFCRYIRRQELRKQREGSDGTTESTTTEGTSASKTSSVEMDTDVKKKVTMNGASAKLRVDASGDKEQKANESQRFLCGLCGVVIQDEARFLEHKKTCTDWYNCEACGVRFKTQAKFIEHKDKNTECVSIDDIFIEEIHGCGACSEKFNTPLKVTMHANKCHQGADNQKAMALFRKDFRQCQVCKVKIHKQATPYYHHMWIKHGVKSNFHSAYYKCDLCHKRYIDPREFEAHETTHEENKMRHACSVCEQKFRRKQLLERHISEKHGGKLKQD